MAVTEMEFEDAVVLTVQDTHLDAQNAEAFKHDMLSRVAGERRLVVLDLSRLENVDSRGLGVLAILFKALAGNGGFLLCGGKEVCGLLHLTKLDKYLPLYASADEALAAARNGSMPS